ncbi:hypothetical protein Emed_007269 [Eimeria media]
MVGASDSQPSEGGLTAALHTQLLAAAAAAAAQHPKACFAEAPSTARPASIAAAAATAAAAARPAAEAAVTGNCSSVHLRLYYRGLEAKRQKQQRKELLLQQQRSRCSTLPASSSSSSSSSSTGLLVSQQLYEDALTRRQKHQQQQQRQQQQQQELRSKSKLSPASLRVFQQRLLKEIRQAYAELQPETPNTAALPAALLPQCMQLLGIFQQQQQQQRQQQQQQQQEDPGLRAKKQLAAAETAERELRLSERLCRVLDPEGLDVVSSERLFQFLAGVLTECGSISSSSSSRLAQFVAADRELKRLGLATIQEKDDCMHTAAGETPQLQHSPPRPRCNSATVTARLVEQGRQQRARRERRQLLLQQQQEEELLRSQWRARPGPFHTGGPSGPPWGPPSSARRKPQTDGCGLPRHVMLYELAQQQQQHQKQQQQQRQQQQQHEALRECTFRPDLSLTSNTGRQGCTSNPSS